MNQLELTDNLVAEAIPLIEIALENQKEAVSVKPFGVFIRRGTKTEGEYLENHVTALGTVTVKEQDFIFFATELKS